ncbi:MAG: hypothetical protein M3Y56_10525, partial [Armatimonadota bacterium]|nr:hypothetical protein [Armatimonadota bacterium]
MTLPIRYRPIVMMLAACVVCAPLAGAQQPSHPASTVGRTIDPRAMALFRKVEKTMLGLKTYGAECYTTIYFPGRPGHGVGETHEYARLRAAKPNKMRYDKWELDRDAKTGQWKKRTAEFDITFACNGRTDWKQFGSTYRTDN